MNKIVYELSVKVWQDRNGSTTIRSEPIYGSPMMHAMSKEEWELVKGIFDALIDPSPPIATIVGLIEDYNEQME